MPHSEPVNWQPISEMPLIAGMIDEALDDTRDHIKTLTEASTRPHVMDDATVDRIDRVHAEQMEFVDIYAEQIGRWRNERPYRPIKRANSTGWRSKTEICATRPQPSSPCPASCARGQSTASWKRATCNSASRRFSGDDLLPAVSPSPRFVSPEANSSARVGSPFLFCPGCRIAVSDNALRPRGASRAIRLRQGFGATRGARPGHRAAHGAAKRLRPSGFHPMTRFTSAADAAGEGLWGSAPRAGKGARAKRPAAAGGLPGLPRLTSFVSCRPAFGGPSGG